MTAGGFFKTSGHTAAGHFRRLTTGSKEILPGLCFTGAVAALAFALHQIPALSMLSPMILAIVIGVGIKNIVGTPACVKAGVAFSLRRILRVAIILLGVQLTAAQVIAVGATGAAVIISTIFATFVFTTVMGRVLGISPKLTQLIAAGTAICGVSAVVATNTVTHARDEDVSYAVACITVFGSLSMLLYPALPALLHLDPRAFGLWTGASIHEIAQVVGASFQQGQVAGEFGTVAKLTRVMMLAPVVLILGMFAERPRVGQISDIQAPRITMPLFIFGFLVVVAINSVVTIPLEAKTWIVGINTFLLSIALAAMGLATDISKLTAKGFRPLALGAAATLFISFFSLILVKMTF
jgi:uncharacterized integral membrane protein (TIGR00698 family)